MPAKINKFNLSTQSIKSGKSKSPAPDRTGQNQRGSPTGDGQTGNDFNNGALDRGGLARGPATFGGESPAPMGPSTGETNGNNAALDWIRGLRGLPDPPQRTDYSPPTPSDEEVPVYPPVGEYERSEFDDELLDKGICSSYPVILAQVPFSNFFEGNTNTISAMGQLYDIQNSIQDDTIKMADKLVNDYFASNPDARSALSALKTKNTLLYNEIVNYVPKIKLSKDNLVANTSTAAIDSQSYAKITSLISTTSADRASNAAAGDRSPTKYLQTKPANLSQQDAVAAATARGNLGSASSMTRQDLEFAIPATDYDDADMRTSTNFKITTPADLTKILLGKTDVAGLAESTIAYQALRCTLADIYYGDGEFSSTSDALDVQALRLTSGGKTNNLEYLQYQANKINILGGVQTFDGNSTTEAFRQYEAALPAFSRTYVNGTCVLASKIASLYSSMSFFDSLGNLSPNAQSISIKDTQNDDISFVYLDSQGRTLILEDLAVPQTRYENCFSMIASYNLSKADLEGMLTRLNKTKIGLENLSSTKKAWLSNQISAFLLKTMMNEFSNFFEKSAWCDASVSAYSAARCAMYRSAASNSNNFRRVYTITNEKLDELSSLGDEQNTLSILKYREEYKGATLNWKISEASNIVIGASQTREFDFTEVATSTFNDKMFDPGSSFGIFNNIVQKVKSQFPDITKDIENLIRLISFNVFMELNKLLPADVEMIVTEEHGGKNFNAIVQPSKLKWSRQEAAIIADICRSCLTATTVDDVSFSTLGTSLTENQKSLVTSKFFNPIRTIVTTTLQKYENVKNVLAFYQGRVTNQQQAISGITSSYSRLINAYEVFGTQDPTLSAYKLTAKYATTESIAEMLQKDVRYKTFINNTRIRSIAGRSKNYRSIVKAAHKDMLTEVPATLMAIGIPYGFFEKIRIASRSARDNATSYTYGVSLYAQYVDQRRDDVEFAIDYISPYVRQTTIDYTKYRFYSTLKTSLFDDTTSSRLVQSVSDSSIQTYTLVISDSNLVKTDVDTDKTTIEQPALESYFEDLYGLYPRYSCNKNTVDIDSMPELTYASIISATAPVQIDETLVPSNSSIEQETILIRSRIRAAIMMHELFSTTYMLKEVESGSVFDKIHYVIYENDKLDAEITQITPRVLI